tara:strand:- start:44 stop:241 length:198 start_codon:yes stop_codon:yes gene_type:complete
MKIREMIERAVNDQDAPAAGAVSDCLRFRHGKNYDEIFEIVNSVAAIDAADWDALLYECDRQHAG